MNEPSSDLSARSLPPWLLEAADVLWARRRLVVAAAIVTAVVGIVVAAVAPSLLPPRAIVGAAVGLAAVLLAAAIGLAVDAADLVVRGGRHIRAAGADVAASVGRDVNDVGPLVARVALKAEGTRVRVALVPASRDAGAPGARATALAESLAKTGRRVLVTDLTRPATPTPGLSEVIAGNGRLADVAHLDDDLYLARVPVGMEPARAIDGFAEWVQHLPSDLEVLIVALPPLAEPGVISAAAVADLVLIQVEADRTERVDLIAALDAVDAAGLSADVILVDPSKSWSPRPEETVADDDGVTEGDDQAAADEDAEAMEAIEPAEDDATEQPDDLEALAALAALESESGPATDPVGFDAVAAEAAGPGIAAGGGAAAAMAASGAAGHHPRDLDHVWDESDDDVPADADDTGTTPPGEDGDEELAGSLAEPEAVEPEVAEPEAVEPAAAEPAPTPVVDAPEPEPAASPEPTPEPKPEPEPDPVPVVNERERAATPAVAEPEPTASTVARPKDEIDELAREAVRTTAALYALAEEVWRREDTG